MTIYIEETMAKQLPIIILIIAVLGFVGIKGYTMANQKNQTAYNNMESFFNSKASTPEKTNKAVKLYGSIILSLLVVGGSLYVIFSGEYKEADIKWVAASIGIVAGVWLA